MNEVSRSAFLIGLPGAGKTTFLAAFYHVLESADFASALKLERLHGDHKHLDEIRGLWADAQPLDRTKVPDERTVSMLIRDGSGFVAEVVLPDLSGESCELQWTDRTMSTELSDLLKQSAGGLLLIHPGTVAEETLIQDVDGIVQRLAANRAFAGEVQPLAPCEAPTLEPIGETTDEWSPEKSPTAVKLVELLQFLARVSPRRPIALSVVVSAWDRAGTTSLPSQWIAERLPLLSQYLAANMEVFSTRCYGVSAQGGDLSEAPVLRKMSQPAERIRVVDDLLHETHDITLPVRWALGFEHAHD